MTKFEKILTLNMTREQKFRPNHKKFFFRPKNYNFCQATKNRPEISISGQIMVIYIIFQNRILGHFLTKFEFGVSWMVEISAIQSKNSRPKNFTYFMATNKKSAGNCYYWPYFGNKHIFSKLNENLYQILQCFFYCWI